MSPTVGLRGLPNVVIVREVDAQVTGGSCCGTLDGGLSDQDGASPFAERRAAMEGAGALAAVVRAPFGDAAHVMQLDPRNIFAVWTVLLRDCIRSRRGWRALLRVLSLSMPVPSVFVDGLAAGPGPTVAAHWGRRGSRTRPARGRRCACVTEVACRRPREVCWFDKERISFCDSGFRRFLVCVSP